MIFESATFVFSCLDEDFISSLYMDEKRANLDSHEGMSLIDSMIWVSHICFCCLDEDFISSLYMDEKRVRKNTTQGVICIPYSSIAENFDKSLKNSLIWLGFFFSFLFFSIFCRKIFGKKFENIREN